MTCRTPPSGEWNRFTGGSGFCPLRFSIWTTKPLWPSGTQLETSRTTLCQTSMRPWRLLFTRYGLGSEVMGCAYYETNLWIQLNSLNVHFTGNAKIISHVLSSVSVLSGLTGSDGLDHRRRGDFSDPAEPHPADEETSWLLEMLEIKERQRHY